MPPSRNNRTPSRKTVILESRVGKHLDMPEEWYEQLEHVLDKRCYEADMFPSGRLVYPVPHDGSYLQASIVAVSRGTVWD